MSAKKTAKKATAKKAAKKAPAKKPNPSASARKTAKPLPHSAAKKAAKKVERAAGSKAIERPSPGTLHEKFWLAFEAMETKLGRLPARFEVRKLAEGKGWNVDSVSNVYGRWRRFNGHSGHAAGVYPKRNTYELSDKRTSRTQINLQGEPEKQPRAPRQPKAAPAAKKTAKKAAKKAVTKKVAKKAPEAPAGDAAKPKVSDRAKKLAQAAGTIPAPAPAPQRSTVPDGGIVVEIPPEA